MGPMMLPFLPLIFLFTVVLATHFQPFYPLDLAQGYTRSVRNSSQLRSDFLHFDGLVMRDDCDPTDSTPCPDGCYRDANDVCCANGGAVPQGDVCCDDSAGGGCAVGLICGFCDTNGVCCSDASCTVLVNTDGSSVTLGPDDCKATAGNTVASVATVGPSGTPTPTPTPTPSTTEQLSTTPSTPAVISTTESPPPPPTSTEAPIPTTSAATVVTVVLTTTSTSTTSPIPTTPEVTTSTELVSPPPESTTSSVAQTAGVGRGVEGHGLLATTALALAVVGMVLMLA